MPRWTKLGSRKTKASTLTSADASRGVYELRPLCGGWPVVRHSGRGLIVGVFVDEKAGTETVHIRPSQTLETHGVPTTRLEPPALQGQELAVHT